MGIGMGRACWTNPTAAAPNPNPGRWERLLVRQYPGAYVLKARYPDCTNFEGVKIMVFRGDYRTLGDTLDPHFSPMPDSPIARFIPNKEGWDLACDLAERLSK